MAPSANNPDHNFAGWVAKPPRMRSACTQCHAAKIRCSSDKKGCQRCKNLGLHCEYAISMVGRTPKRRGKNATSASNRAPPSSPDRRPSGSRSSSERLSESGFAVEHTSIGTNKNNDNFDINGDPSLLQTDFDTDHFFDDFDGDSWVSSAGSIYPSSFPEDIQLPDVTQFEIADFPIPAPAQTATTNHSSLSVNAVFPPPLLTPTSSMSNAIAAKPSSPNQQNESMRASNGPDYQQFGHILALCKMLRLLESQAQTNSTAVDEVMKLNQACIADVSKISSKSDYMQCKSCPALISTIMELIVSRYEEITQDTYHGPLSASTLPHPTSPCLQFGVFELDHEAQAIIRNRIIRREAQKCVIIIRTLKSSLESDIPTNNDASSQTHALGNWYQGMEKRMNDPISRLLPDSRTIDHEGQRRTNVSRAAL